MRDRKKKYESLNTRWESHSVNKFARSVIKNQHPRVVWFTGYSGSGKTTIANALEVLLHSQGKHTAMLDGDNIRFGLNRDLGFDDLARVENIRRISEVAKLMVESGLIVIVSSISPFRADRRMARNLFESGEFVEVFVDTPLHECIRRDPKGLYRMAMAGKIQNFTGISSNYEPPELPEVHLNTMAHDASTLALMVHSYINAAQIDMANR